CASPHHTTTPGLLILKLKGFQCLTHQTPVSVPTASQHAIGPSSLFQDDSCLLAHSLPEPPRHEYKWNTASAEPITKVLSFLQSVTLTQPPLAPQQPLSYHAQATQPPSTCFATSLNHPTSASSPALQSMR